METTNIGFLVKKRDRTNVNTIEINSSKKSIETGTKQQVAKLFIEKARDTVYNTNNTTSSRKRGYDETMGNVQQIPSPSTKRWKSNMNKNNINQPTTSNDNNDNILFTETNNISFLNTTSNSTDINNNNNISFEGNRNKEIANILQLMINKQLTCNDRIGITCGYKIIQNLQYANKIDIDSIEKEIIFLKNDKGENNEITSQESYLEGIKLFKKFGIEYNENYENRIIFITVGFSDSKKEFDAHIYACDENLRIYTTVIGIGMGLTNELNKRCRFRGCNFVNVSNANQLKQYFNEINKFTYLVTPIFYDINLKLKCSNNCHIDKIYGSKNNKYNKYVIKKGILQKIHTLFASNESIKIVKTGILLIKLISNSNDKNEENINA
eukprot:121996_1